MCCSKKWVGGLAALVAAVVGLGVVSQTKFGQDWGGWVGVQFSKMFNWADEQRSLDDEIVRLENEVKDLDKHKVSLKDRSYTLKDEIKTTKAEVEKQRDALNSLRTAMNARKLLIDEASGNEFVSVEGVKTSVATIRKNLVENTDKFEKGYAAFQTKQALLAKMESNLIKVNDGITSVDQTQLALKTELGALKAKLEEVRLDETSKANSKGDDELNKKLEYIRAGVKDVSKKVNVMAERSKDNVASSEVTTPDGVEDKIKGEKAQDKLVDINKIDLSGNK